MQDVTGIVIIVAGIGVMAWCLVGKWKVAQTKSWRRVDAEIVGSDAAEIKGEHTSYGHQSVIEYAYRIAGRPYRATCVSAGGVFNTNLERAARRCRRYPVGKKVTAFYDPGNPARACLERKVEGIPRYLMIGAGISVFGLLVRSGLIHLSR